MADNPLRLLIIGAHPDDADYHAGGTAALYRQVGHVVKMVSLTNGDAGHQTLRGPELAARRRAEAADAGATIGASYDVFDNHDGQLLPTLENRLQVIRLIRSFHPDLVLTHRPNDYHPDHRYTSQLVQDAAYMVTVPAVAPDTPHLARNPVIAYLPDDFQKPYPFQPSVAVDVGGVFEQIVDMLQCHRSQFYEWLPYNSGRQGEVPPDDAGRRAWLAAGVAARLRRRAEGYRELLLQCYGPERGPKVEYAEAFEGCEYGASLDEAALRRLFPFAP
jgi:LmbE family N-acetylglucosaminyl deacetylase